MDAKLLARLQYVQHEMYLAEERIKKCIKEIAMREGLIEGFKADQQRLKEQLGMVEPETMTNEEAQAAVDSGEAEIPADAVIAKNGKIRIHEAAKLHNVTGKELIEALEALGINGKTSLSYITIADLAKIFPNKEAN